jgi:hypothetical protein
MFRGPEGKNDTEVFQLLVRNQSGRPFLPVDNLLLLLPVHGTHGKVVW